MHSLSDSDDDDEDAGGSEASLHGGDLDFSREFLMSVCGLAGDGDVCAAKGTPARALDGGCE